MRTFDVIIVGGGVAGLIAAGFAAKRGASVALLEAAATLGGRARTRSLQGYHLNQGAHAFYLGGSFDAALRELGVRVTGSAPALSEGFFVRDARLHKAPLSAAGIAATTLLPEIDKPEFGALLRSLGGLLTDIRVGMPVGQTLAGLSDSEDIRSALAAMIRLTSIVHAPELADGRSLLEQLAAGLKRDVRYLDDGWGTIVEGLKSACSALGVSLADKCRADLVAYDGMWNVLLGNQKALSARSVVLAVNPLQAAKLCPPLARVARPVAAKVACLDLGLRRLPRPEALFALGVDRPLYLSVHSAAARLAPEGASLIHVMRYLDPAEKPDRVKLLAELEDFVDLVQPGWREEERVRQFLPAMPSMSSIPLAANGGVDGRPDVAVEAADGLFIAGDWVGPNGLLGDASAGSGRAAGEAAAALANGWTGVNAQGSRWRSVDDKVVPLA